MAYISVNGYDFPPPKRGAKPTVSTMVDAGRSQRYGRRTESWARSVQTRHSGMAVADGS